MAEVAVELDAAGNVNPPKTKCAQRFDGTVASSMALGRAMFRPAKPKDARTVEEPAGQSASSASAAVSFARHSAASAS